ncbi:MAG: XRE family transcriptional regulator [Treponemataceae bacterium]|nr:XRE family transcriptional regulator [Treponemataceae bacterium]
MSEKNRIGEKVRTIRESRKLTIEDVSERTNLSAEGIERIEKGELIPGLTPLIKIARVLGVRLGTFMDDQEDLGPVLVRSKDSENQNSVTRFSERNNAASSDLDFYTLAQNKADRHMDPFVIEVFPPSHEEVKLSTHEGEEFIYVLDGEIEVMYGKDVYELSAGDSIYYDSIVAHHLHARGDKSAKILAVVYTPA